MAENNGGFVVTEKSDDGTGTDTVIVTDSGVTVHHCPSGLTEDDLVD
ncbi:hypothetical protein AB0E08_10970 [Streptomyces sp. NPDC048281]